MINVQNVKYTFTFTPKDAFTKTQAKVKLVFPDQVKIASTAKLTTASSNKGGLVSTTKAKLTVTDSKAVIISDLFTSNYTPTDAITLTLDSITNPSTVTTTDSF